MGADTLFIPHAPDYVMVSDTKAAGSQGDTITTGSFQTVTLNTEDSDPSGIASLGSNQVTLQPGTYEALIFVPIYIGESSNVRLRNITDGTTVLVGQALYHYQSAFVANNNVIQGRFTLAAAKALAVQAWVVGGVGTPRIGYNLLNSGEVVKFTQAIFRRVAL